MHSASAALGRGSFVYQLEQKDCVSVMEDEWFHLGPETAISTSEWQQERITKCNEQRCKNWALSLSALPAMLTWFLSIKQGRELLLMQPGDLPEFFF